MLSGEAFRHEAGLAAFGKPSRLPFLAWKSSLELQRRTHGGRLEVSVGALQVALPEGTTLFNNTVHFARNT